MPGFNLVPEIGGVDTSDTTRPLSPQEQGVVIEHVFGASHGEGALNLPGGEKIYIGKRSGKKKGYTFGTKEEAGLRRPAIFVTADPEDTRTLLAETRDGDLEGILYRTTCLLLTAGKHSMREAISGENIPVKSRPSKAHRENRADLAHFLLLQALVGEEDEMSELDLGYFYERIDSFLGQELANTEVRVRLNEPALNWSTPPLETLCADIGGRIAGLVVPEA